MTQPQLASTVNKINISNHSPGSSDNGAYAQPSCPPLATLTTCGGHNITQCFQRQRACKNSRNSPSRGALQRSLLACCGLTGWLSLLGGGILQVGNQVGPVLRLLQAGEHHLGACETEGGGKIGVNEYRMRAPRASSGRRTPSWCLRTGEHSTANWQARCNTVFHWAE